MTAPRGRHSIFLFVLAALSDVLSITLVYQVHLLYPVRIISNALICKHNQTLFSDDDPFLFSSGIFFSCFFFGPMVNTKVILSIMFFHDELCLHLCRYSSTLCLSVVGPSGDNSRCEKSLARQVNMSIADPNSVHSIQCVVLLPFSCHSPISPDLMIKNSGNATHFASTLRSQSQS